VLLEEGLSRATKYHPLSAEWLFLHQVRPLQLSYEHGNNLCVVMWGTLQVYLCRFAMTACPSACNCVWQTDMLHVSAVSSCAALIFHNMQQSAARHEPHNKVWSKCSHDTLMQGVLLKVHLPTSGWTCPWLMMGCLASCMMMPSRYVTPPEKCFAAHHVLSQFWSIHNLLKRAVDAHLMHYEDLPKKDN